MFLLFFCLSGCFFASRITDGSGTYFSTTLDSNPIRGIVDDEGKLQLKFSVKQVESWRSPYVFTRRPDHRTIIRSSESRELNFEPLDFQSIPNAHVISVKDQNSNWLNEEPYKVFSVLTNKGELPVYYYPALEIDNYPEVEALIVNADKIYWFKPHWQGLEPAKKLLFSFSEESHPNFDLSTLAPLAIVGDVLTLPLFLVASIPSGLIETYRYRAKDPDHDGISCQAIYDDFTEQGNFALDKWALGTTEERAKMFSDLAKMIEFSKPTRDQILSLLGPGNSHSTYSHLDREYITMIKYYQKQGRRVPTQNMSRDPEAAYCLTIRFSPSGLFQRVEINGMNAHLIKSKPKTH
jgi:hypothetical protein